MSYSADGINVTRALDDNHVAEVEFRIVKEGGCLQLIALALAQKDFTVVADADYFVVITRYILQIGDGTSMFRPDIDTLARPHQRLKNCWIVDVAPVALGIKIGSVAQQVGYLGIACLILNRGDRA